MRAAPPCCLRGFPPAAVDADGLISPFFILPGQSLYFPRILQFLFFHESIYSKRAKCNQNRSSLRMPLYIAFKRVYQKNLCTERRQRRAVG